MNNSYSALVVAGASGSGKSTIVKHLVHRFPDTFTLSISYTTRTPREKEIDGRDYHFISQEEFNEKIKKNEFIEYAEYAGNYYGTGIEYSTVEKGKILLLEIEKKGVKKIKESGLNAAYLYIYASMSVLHARISQRAIITQDELSKRLMKAKEENMYGCSDEFDEVINNEDLETTLKEAEEFVKSKFNVK
ncbi:guanylate kinase [Nematocida minor]|uniref:guanylate kinase n=1 Tax=Nematocida minor TaxID=1912983 RepID=UPI00222074B5|nr:guanylate kinase [Nematocida minor]KAI5190034.1 guanylate kinase [Nematocida minor]